MTQFTIIALAHLLALISPGQDMLLLLKEYSKSNENALYAILGITLSNSIHVTLSIAGLALIILSNPVILMIFKTVMGLYLIYMGLQIFLSKNKLDIGAAKKTHIYSKRASFVSGLLISIFNPKVTLFYFALFSQVISVETDLTLKVLYGGYLTLATGIGFCIILLALNLSQVKRVLLRFMNLIQKATGGVLVFLGIKTILT